MVISALRTLRDLRRIKPHWDAVYADDPDAQFFLSWDWIWNWVQVTKIDWCILAIRPDESTSPYVAFLPLRIRTIAGARGGRGFELAMLGNRVADYTGILCMPRYQTKAVLALGKYLRHMPWTTLKFENICASAERSRLLANCFPRRQFAVEMVRGGGAVHARSEPDEEDRGDAVDQLVCPFARLPADWDQFLDGLGRNTRQKARRFLRKVDDETSDISIRLATAETLDRDIEILLGFWRRKWAPRKRERTDTICNNLRVMLTRIGVGHALLLPVLWRGDQPMGALGTIIDARKRSLLFMVSGCDTTTNNPPPGFVLHAYSLRYAIANGFQIYDFLRGNEAYKYAFASAERSLVSLAVERKAPRTLPVKIEGAAPRRVPDWEEARPALRALVASGVQRSIGAE